MIRTNDNGIRLTIIKDGDYTKEISVVAWTTVEEAFDLAGVDYENWTYEGMAYNPDDSFENSDNGWRIYVSTKQIKQG